MRLVSAVIVLGTLGTVACQQIYDIVCVEDTCRRSGLHSPVDFFPRKVADDMGQGDALHLLSAHPRSNQFRDAWPHR